MSASRKREGVSSPVTRYYEWSGQDGHFYYFDKEKGDNGEKVPVKEIKLCILDGDIAEVSGYSDKDQSGMYSNMVRDTTTQILRVQFSKGKDIVNEGLWSDIKDSITARGGKFQKVVFAYDTESREIVCIKVKGAAISSWIEKTNELKLNDVSLNKLWWNKEKHTEQKKKGSTNYFAPQFVFVPMDEKKDKELMDICIAKDEVLQAYLDAKMGSSKEDNAPMQEESNDTYVPKSEPAQTNVVADDDLPF